MQGHFGDRYSYIKKECTPVRITQEYYFTKQNATHIFCEILIPDTLCLNKHLFARTWFYDKHKTVSPSAKYIIGILELDDEMTTVGESFNLLDYRNKEL